MTVIDTDLTLGTLVTDHPALARELERLGLALGVDDRTARRAGGTARQ